MSNCGIRFTKDLAKCSCCCDQIWPTFTGVVAIIGGNRWFSICWSVQLQTRRQRRQWLSDSYKIHTKYGLLQKEYCQQTSNATAWYMANMMEFILESRLPRIWFFFVNMCLLKSAHPCLYSHCRKLRCVRNPVQDFYRSSELSAIVWTERKYELSRNLLAAGRLAVV